MGREGGGGVSRDAAFRAGVIGARQSSLRLAKESAPVSSSWHRLGLRWGSFRIGEAATWTPVAIYGPQLDIITLGHSARVMFQSPTCVGITGRASTCPLRPAHQNPKASLVYSTTSPSSSGLFRRSSTSEWLSDHSAADTACS